MSYKKSRIALKIRVFPKLAQILKLAKVLYKDSLYLERIETYRGSEK
jgi:hypothetical protein